MHESMSTMPPQVARECPCKRSSSISTAWRKYKFVLLPTDTSVLHPIFVRYSSHPKRIDFFLGPPFRKIRARGSASVIAPWSSMNFIAKLKCPWPSRRSGGWSSTCAPPLWPHPCCPLLARNALPINNPRCAQATMVRPDRSSASLQ